MTMSLQKLASEANKPRVRCEGENCSCNDYARRMNAFHKVATPERILQMLAEGVDQSTKLEIALDALVDYPEARATPSLLNAIETLRGK